MPFCFAFIHHSPSDPSIGPQRALIVSFSTDGRILSSLLSGSDEPPQTRSGLVAETDPPPPPVRIRFPQDKTPPLSSAPSKSSTCVCSDHSDTMPRKLGVRHVKQGAFVRNDGHFAPVVKSTVRSTAILDPSDGTWALSICPEGMTTLMPQAMTLIIRLPSVDATLCSLNEDARLL